LGHALGRRILGAVKTRTSRSRVGWCAVSRLILVGVIGQLAACASTPPAPTHHLRLQDANGSVVYQGAASYVLRHPENVVTIRGVGEIQIGVDGDANRCRLVRPLPDSAIAIWNGVNCPHVDGDALCFSGTVFAGETPKQRLRADGCAYQNDLKWSKLQGSQPASIGPGAWRRRCIPITTPTLRCAPTFMRLDGMALADNTDPQTQFSFGYDGERFLACFLERESGRYQVQLTVEDECGQRAFVELDGDSAELDD
jgi:hypothetical protein